MLRSSTSVRLPLPPTCAALTVIHSEQCARHCLPRQLEGGRSGSQLNRCAARLPHGPVLVSHTLTIVRVQSLNLCLGTLPSRTKPWTVSTVWDRHAQSSPSSSLSRSPSRPDFLTCKRRRRIWRTLRLARSSSPRSSSCNGVSKSLRSSSTDPPTLPSSVHFRSTYSCLCLSSINCSWAALCYLASVLSSLSFPITAATLLYMYVLLSSSRTIRRSKKQPRASRGGFVS